MVKRQSDTLNAIFGALADPTRRTILEELAKGDRSVTDLSDPHDMSMPAISKHLSVLEHAGLIARTKDGRLRRCSLSGHPLKDAANWLEQYRTFWEGRFDALEEVLTGSKKKQK
ncbi:MAG: ArsR family transcriptional regulator [Bacteroidetes bacterium]|nr:ArsR family transcriptional regulator [Bacteroidota bacterium]